MIDEIRAAGDHLLDVLVAEKAVNYSRFYNSDPAAETALVEGVWKHLESQPVKLRGELEDHHREAIVNEGHLLVEWAAWQLDSLGVVTIETLEGTKLIDGEPDYRITLTGAGEKFLKEGRPFGYRHVDSRFLARGASEWLIMFLYEGGEGETITLRHAMDPYHFAPDDAIVDDCKNAYPPGSPAYAWAYEVSLWHHARSKHVEPVPEDDTQRRAWEELVARPHLFSMWVVKDAPLWDVPFKLVRWVNADQLQLVGWIGGE